MNRSRRTTSGVSNVAHEDTALKVANFTVVKDTGGRWRWVTISSTAFRDKDGEIVSTKALADDVARADQDGMYGPLRWWHVPGADLGDCDFNAMSGRTLIESGTFRDERYGPLVAAKADTLGVSIGFHHSATEPDADRTFHRIRRFERSLVPLPYPANPYTALVIKEMKTVDETKIAALKALGVDVESMLAAAANKEQAATADGVAFKDTTKANDDVVTDSAEVGAVAGVLVGGMAPAEFLTLLNAANQPIVDALAALAGVTATKSSADGATAAALKAASDQQAATAALVTTLQAQLAAAQADQAKVAATVKELSGDVPAGIRRASQDSATVLSAASVEAIKGPAPDPLNDFVNSFVMPGAAG